MAPQMPKQKSVLATYLQRVLALKEERRTVPSAEELRAIAMDLGLSEADLADVDQAAEDHYLRGQGFLERDRYDDAIVELEESVALSPRSVERLHALALAHTGRWHERREPANRERAERLARECLELDPRHGGSFEVLDRLDQAPAAPSEGAKPRPTRALILAALVLVAIVVANVVFRSPSDPEPPAVPDPVNAPAKAAAPPATEPHELDLPVDLDPGSSGLALELEVRQSRLLTYANGKSFLTLNALFANRGATELDKLGMRLVLLDAAGSVLEEESFDALSSSSPVLRPGDRQAIHRLRETSSTLRRLRMVVDTVDQNPAAESYAPAKPIPLDWLSERSADLDVALRERAYRFSEKSFPKDGSGYFDAVLEIENASQRTLRQLTLRVEIVGPGERWTAATERHVVLTSGPALHPGEIRLERFLHEVEERPDSYHLSVVSAR